MNTLQRIISVGAILLSLAGCREYGTEYYPKQENAIVSFKEYKKATTDFSIDFDGNISVNSTPARYNISFEGEINFRINNKDIYDKFDLEDLAEIKYREVHRLVYEDINNDKRMEMIEDKIVGYDFVDAQLIKDEKRREVFFQEKMKELEKK